MTMLMMMVMVVVVVVDDDDSDNVAGFPRILESPGFFPVFPRPWKLLEYEDPG